MGKNMSLHVPAYIFNKAKTKISVLFPSHINIVIEEEGDTCSWEKGTSSPGERNHFILRLSPFLYLKICVGIASGENTCFTVCPFKHRWEHGYESWAFSLLCSLPPTSFSPRFPHTTVIACVSCHHYQTRRVPNSKPFNFISFKGLRSLFPTVSTKFILQKSLLLYAIIYGTRHKCQNSRLMYLCYFLERI